MEDIDKETIIKAANGDINAYEALYKWYFSYVSNVACRTVRNPETAEEVVQEVFLIVYRKLKSFRHESSLKTWIYRITLNCSINYAKQESRHRKNTVEYQEGISDAHLIDEGHQDSISEEENEKMISTLLDALNPDQRSCIILRSLEGLSYQEIAQTLKVPLNTVRTRIKRARETMLALKKEVMKNELRKN